MSRRLPSFIAAWLLLASPVASAAPTYVYEFFVESADCGVPDPAQPSCAGAVNTMRRLLSDLEVTLTDDAVRAGAAHLHLQYSDGLVVYENDGFAGYSAPDVIPAVDLAALPESGIFNINATFVTNIYLRGTFRIDSTEENILMATAGSDLWSGSVQADWATWSGNFPLQFTGEWRLVQVIPEPGGLAIGALLVAFVSYRRKKRAP